MKIRTVQIFLYMLMAFCLTSACMVVFLGAVAAPWDGYLTDSPSRPSLESANGRVNAYFESGPGDYLLFIPLVISLIIIGVRFAIKREPLDQLCLNTIAAYAVYWLLSIIALVFLVAFPANQVGYNPHEIAVCIAPVIALYILQYQVSLINSKPPKISNPVD